MTTKTSAVLITESTSDRSTPRSSSTALILEQSCNRAITHQAPSTRYWTALLILVVRVVDRAFLLDAQEAEARGVVAAFPASLAVEDAFNLDGRNPLVVDHHLVHRREVLLPSLVSLFIDSDLVVGF